MKLGELLSEIETVALGDQSCLDQEILGLSTNSQTCRPGDLFIGMPGTKVDGGEFWPDALKRGAVAALISIKAADQIPPQNQDPLFQAENLTVAAAKLGARYHGYPGQQLKLIGVTGTNGKTTTTHLIEFFLNQSQLPTGMIGTLYTRWSGFERIALHTTPFAVDLQAQLAKAKQAGNQAVVMEVSSHALAQGRVLECPFSVAVFTNLTQDHLDFHKDLEDYFQAKALLFTPTYLDNRAIINFDDPYGQRLIASVPQNQVWSYSLTNNQADLWTTDLVYGPRGVSGIIHTPCGSGAFTSPLVGQFNLANLLAAVGATLALDLSLEQILSYLPNFPGVPGRMEKIQVESSQDLSVIVDYAHTPDSLENLLKAARPFISGQMICVFGCGGDRDRTKRPMMGRIAAELADQVIVTSDNPRTESPQAILDDILTGIPPETTPVVIADRAVAIAQAIAEAQPGDGVLIAGKGHEDYQILGTTKVHFDDREEARKALLNWIRARQ